MWMVFFTLLLSAAAWWTDWRIQTHAPSINIIFTLHGRACLRAAEHTDVKMHSSVATHAVCMCIPCAGAPVGDWLWCYLLVDCDRHLNTLTPRRILEELLSHSSCLSLALRLWRSLKVTHAICKLHWKKKRSCSNLSPTLKVPIMQWVQKGFRPFPYFWWSVMSKELVFCLIRLHSVPHRDGPNPEFKNISQSNLKKNNQKRDITCT